MVAGIADVSGVSLVTVLCRDFRLVVANFELRR